METTAARLQLSDARHPEQSMGPVISLYVWQYPIRFFHWAMVISIGVLSATGYYIHNPFIVGQVNTQFLMGWFRFVHEVFGMLLGALFLMRMYLFFEGNRWVRWRSYVPLHWQQFAEMWEVDKFYAFLRPTPVSKIGHNAMAAFSYLGLYGMMLVEIVTGLVMFNILRHSTILTPLVGWIPRLINIQNLRLAHFLMMFLFVAFGVFHVHLCLLISRVEKRGLMDSIFIGYKLIPAAEVQEEAEREAKEESGTE